MVAGSGRTWESVLFYKSIIVGEKQQEKQGTVHLERKLGDGRQQCIIKGWWNSHPKTSLTYNWAMVHIMYILNCLIMPSKRNPILLYKNFACFHTVIIVCLYSLFFFSGEKKSSKIVSSTFAWNLVCRGTNSHRKSNGSKS